MMARSVQLVTALASAVLGPKALVVPDPAVLVVLAGQPRVVRPLAALAVTAAKALPVMPAVVTAVLVETVLAATARPVTVV